MSGRPTSRITHSMPGASSASSRPVAPSRRQLDDVAVVLEQALEQPRQPRVVLDDEQVHGRQPTRRSRLAPDRDVVRRSASASPVPRSAPLAGLLPIVDRPPIAWTATSSPTATALRRPSAVDLVVRGVGVEVQRHLVAARRARIVTLSASMAVTVPSMVGPPRRGSPARRGARSVRCPGRTCRPGRTMTVPPAPGRGRRHRPARSTARWRRRRHRRR